MIEKIYMLLILTCLILGYYFFISGLPKKKAFTQKASLIVSIKAYFSRKLKNDTRADRRFREIGLNITTYHYNIFRLSLLVILILISTLQGNILAFILSALFIVMLEPDDKIFGFSSPFALITKSLKERRGEKLDSEIYRLCVLLKNLAIVQKDKPWGADYIFTQLISSAKELKDPLIKMQMDFRLGNEEEAFETLAYNIGTKTGKEFAQILSKLDSLNPIETVQQITNFQDNLQEQKLTLELRRAESRSNIVFVMTTLTVLVLLLNFAVLVIFMDALEMLNNLSVL